MLPQSFGRFSTAGPTVRGLVSQAFFSTRDGTDMVELIDGESAFNDVVVRFFFSVFFLVVVLFPLPTWGALFFPTPPLPPRWGEAPLSLAPSLYRWPLEGFAVHGLWWMCAVGRV
jgi:hypothetical protein